MNRKNMDKLSLKTAVIVGIGVTVGSVNVVVGSGATVNTTGGFIGCASVGEATAVAVGGSFWAMALAGVVGWQPASSSIANNRPKLRVWGKPILFNRRAYRS